MSRYSEIINDVKYSWGFDKPLNEYFFHAENMLIEDEDDALIFAISSYHTMKPHPNHPNKMTYTNGELLSIMEDIIPDNHARAIALDLPF